MHRKCTLGAYMETNKIDFYTKCWSKKHFYYNENTFHEQNLTMNITAKRNMSYFNTDWTNGKF